MTRERFDYFINKKYDANLIWGKVFSNEKEMFDYFGVKSKRELRTDFKLSYTTYNNLVETVVDSYTVKIKDVDEETIFIYKGEEISTADFIRLIKNAGLYDGSKISYYNHLKDLAEKGEPKAIALLKDLKIEYMPMITRYCVSDADDLQLIAKQLKKDGTITIREYNGNTHKEKTVANTRIQVGFRAYGVTEFINKYL